MAIGAQISVTRVGTQVVVRMRGDIGDADADALRAAMDDITELALRLVTVDLSEADRVEGMGLDFLEDLRGRWKVRTSGRPRSGRPQLHSRRSSP